MHGRRILQTMLFKRCLSPSLSCATLVPPPSDILSFPSSLSLVGNFSDSLVGSSLFACPPPSDLARVYDVSHECALSAPLNVLLFTPAYPTRPLTCFGHSRWNCPLFSNILVLSRVVLVSYAFCRFSEPKRVNALLNPPLSLQLAPPP